jgi:MFS family permease
MAFRTPAVALMPDVTLKPHRTLGNGIINVMGVIGGLTGMVIFMVFITTESHPTEPYRNLIVLDNMATAAFIFVGALLIVSNVILFLVIKENRLVKKREELQIELGLMEEEAGGKGEKLSKGQLISIGLLLVSIFFWFIAYNAIETWYTTYAFNVLEFSPGAAGMGMIFSLAFGFIAFIPASMLAVKIGRKRAVMTGILIKLTGLLTIFFITPETSFIVYVPMALVGIGWATINASSFVMVVELSKNANLGRFVGLYYVASMSAQAITPMLSGLLRDIVCANTGSYSMGLRSVFIYSAVFMTLALITMTFTKHGNTYKLEDKVAKQEVKTG